MPPRSNGKQLDGSHSQHPEGAEELGQTVEDIGAGRCIHSDVGSFLPLHSAGRSTLWRRDLGCDPAHRAAAGGSFKQPGRQEYGIW